MSAQEDWEFVQNMVPGMTYVSRSFPDGHDVEPAVVRRFATKVIDSDGGLICEREGTEIVIRRTPSNRQAIKALFFNDSRELDELILQKFTVTNGNPHKLAISLKRQDLETIQWLLRLVERATLDTPGRVHFNDEMMSEIFGNDDEFFDFVMRNKERLQQFEDVRDLREYLEFKERRDQLAVFENLLTDSVYFEDWKSEYGIRRDEAVWQHFFEDNHWIFGLGLNPIPMSSLRGEKLETTVEGFSIAGEGKRADALMKTNGKLSALCFVEIKKHSTPLLEQLATAHRPGVWRMSTELTGAISQCHLTVQAAMRRIGTKLSIEDEYGIPTGEHHFLYQPRSFLVVGSLNEFMADSGPNEMKYRSFELLRRNLTSPEIITFDELLERARATVELNRPTHE